MAQDMEEMPAISPYVAIARRIRVRAYIDEARSRAGSKSLPEAFSKARRKGLAMKCEPKA